MMRRQPGDWFKREREIHRGGRCSLKPPEGTSETSVNRSGHAIYSEDTEDYRSQISHWSLGSVETSPAECTKSAEQAEAALRQKSLYSRSETGSW